MHVDRNYPIHWLVPKYLFVGNHIPHLESLIVVLDSLQIAAVGPGQYLLL